MFTRQRQTETQTNICLSWYAFKYNFIIQHHLNELLTKKWLTGSHAVDTICVTVEDYFNDFNKIKKPFNQVAWQQNQC